MTNQALIRKTVTTTTTFTDSPNEETRKALTAAGFTYDARAHQWYRSAGDGAVVAEENVASIVGA